MDAMGNGLDLKVMLKKDSCSKNHVHYNLPAENSPGHAADIMLAKREYCR